MKKTFEFLFAIILVICFVFFILIGFNSKPNTTNQSLSYSTAYPEIRKDFSAFSPLPSFSLEQFSFSAFEPFPTLEIDSSDFQPTTAPPTTPTPKSLPQQEHEDIVFVSKYKKIHTNPNCSGMKDFDVMPFSEAINRGYFLCQKCY